MSADNGWILRKNIYGKFVLQEYCASLDHYPPIDDPKAKTFTTIEAALAWYQTTQPYSEYGLSVQTMTITYNNSVVHKEVCGRHGEDIVGGECHRCATEIMRKAGVNRTLKRLRFDVAVFNY